SANWNSPQTVTLSAPVDGDTVNSTATVTISAAGLVSQTVAVTAVDNDMQRLVVSASSLTFNEGSSGSFTVKLADQPSSDVIVRVARTSGSSNISVSSGELLIITSNNCNTHTTTPLTPP